MPGCRVSRSACTNRQGPSYLAAVIATPAASAQCSSASAANPFDGEDWLFEPKWDGWRCIAVVRHGRARLLSRNGNDLTARFP